MEHREPPRIATADDPSHDFGERPRSGSSLRALRHSAERRAGSRGLRSCWRSSRVRDCCTSSPWSGSYGLRSLRTFVHEQAEYQLAFGEIELKPPPPSWYRGGSKQLLGASPRRRAAHRERFSLLDLDLGAARIAFHRHGWVRKVGRRAPNPNRVSSASTTASPWPLVGGGRSREDLIDRDAVILARDDVELEAVGHLDLIHRKVRSAPFDPQVGRNVEGGERPERAARGRRSVCSRAPGSPTS